MSAFPAVVDAIFADNNIGEDAIWRPGGIGAGVAVRVIGKSPDKIVGFGDSRAVMPSALIDVQFAEMALPAAGDTVEIDGSIFDIIAEPTADSLQLVWTCEASVRL
ncbi:MAG: hypothetical protein K8F58_08255 [Bauldia sp.]|nr:hypothetical protein [Bauldia sp.]